jgi:hypothetical protein
MRKSGISTPFTCPNPLCEKVFINPLKALNLQQQTGEPYSACPYCLTEIVINQIVPNNEPEEKVDKSIPYKEKPMLNKEKPADCRYKFGYLSEREKKDQIPDECICCKDILECMLRKIR